MSFLSSIENFFHNLFGAKTGAVIQTVLTDIKTLYADAEPIVASISAVITAEDLVSPSTVLTKVSGVIATFEKDASKVNDWVTANAGLSIPMILQNAAVFALSSVSGVGVLKDLQLACQLAFSVFAKLNPSTTGTATVAAIATAPAAPTVPATPAA